MGAKAPTPVPTGPKPKPSPAPPPPRATVTRSLPAEFRTEFQQECECKRRVILACHGLGFSLRMIAAGVGLSPARVMAIVEESGGKAEH